MIELAVRFLEIRRLGLHTTAGSRRSVVDYRTPDFVNLEETGVPRREE